MNKKFSRWCLIIKPDGSMNPIKLTFDYETNQPFNEITGKTSFDYVTENFKIKYGCSNCKNKIISTISENHIFYSMYYNKNIQNGELNTTATNIINEKETKCYGNCYIVCFDYYYDMHNVAIDEFMDLCNEKVLTIDMNNKYKNQNRRTCIIN
ncbi:putative ORFan [Tupanvirus deep ocean]|uniref:ORFan n=2 Tax=Tupanvirus TaxID=2094720 RepID=A0AC62AA92_9VIRU|nr:putative ORFan [Tupanvirus deep ocean]QKU34602.1 putative ORFan [Tupanvirus deep ocean]